MSAGQAVDEGTGWHGPSLAGPVGTARLRPQPHIIMPPCTLHTCRPTLAGRGYMDVNRISGYLPGKMVFFLMQASGPCPAGPLFLCCISSGPLPCAASRSARQQGAAVYPSARAHLHTEPACFACPPLLSHARRAGVPCWCRPAAQDLAHPARRVALQHPGQDWRQLWFEVSTPAGRMPRAPPLWRLSDPLLNRLLPTLSWEQSPWPDVCGAAARHPGQPRAQDGGGHAVPSGG